MIEYLTHPKLIDYNPFLLPSKQGGGGGIHVKTYFVREALDSVYPNSRLISDSAEISADIVLIEPLRLSLPIEPSDRDHETNDMLLAGLEASDAKIILLATEFSLLRLQPSVRTKLLTLCDAVTASCKFQARLLKYVGIETSHIIRDPISDIYCSPVAWKEREAQIVAVGNISWQKNTQHLIELFKALEGKVRRVYVGSHSLWRSEDQDAASIRLQNELYDHCDKVIPECTITELAKLFYKTRYGVWVATHDTTSTATISMFRSGIPVVGAAHGYSDEIPTRTAQGLTAQVQAIEDMLTMGDDEMEVWSDHVADWCEKNVSYPSFIEQLNSVIRTVWGGQ